MYKNLDKATLSNLNYFMPETNILQQLANTFSVFADPTRLKILSALSLCDMCVTDMSTYLNINQTTLSHQLKFLKSFNAVEFRREGKVIIYKIKYNKINEIMSKGVDYMLN